MREFTFQESVSRAPGVTDSIEPTTIMEQDGKTLRFPGGGNMNFILQPWQLFFLILSGWVNR